jgi:hypothetical protein
MDWVEGRVHEYTRLWPAMALARNFRVRFKIKLDCSHFLGEDSVQRCYAEYASLAKIKARFREMLGCEHDSWFIDPNFDIAQGHIDLFTHDKDWMIQEVLTNGLSSDLLMRVALIEYRDA